MKNIDLEFLFEILRYDTTINPERGIFPEESCVKAIKKYATSHNFEVLELPSVYFNQNQSNNQVYPCVFVKKGNLPGKTILFLGHTDVVPVTEQEKLNWKSNPFEPTITEDGYLRCRGASDMKGGISAFFSAFNSYTPKRGNIVIALSGDEEIGGFDSMPIIINALKENNLLPDYVINAEPSKRPVIVTKRRGATWLKIHFKDERKLTKGKKKQITFNSFQGNGSETLHSMAFVLGSDSHAMLTAGKFSVDQKIVNVLSSSSKTNSVPKSVEVTYIDTDSPVSEELEYSFALSNVMSGLASIGSINWPIIPSKYGIAVNPNIINYDENENQYELIFDIRAMHEDENAHHKIASLIKTNIERFGTKIEVELLNGIDPVNVDRDSYLPTILNHVCNEEGLNIVDIGEKYGGASDTRFFTDLGIPGVELGPEGYNDHGTNEIVSLESLNQLVVIFRKVFDRLAESE
jgi:acetylornithine deacetylase/succinyl-diaminopimelate desuccinylase-like protein